MDGRGQLGRRGEDLAAEFLQALAFEIVARNFRCRAGEIDLVALDGRALVFIEVRSRHGERHGSGLESVTARKRAQVARVAQYFLAGRGWSEREARFDVIGIDFASDPPRVDHVRAAFEVGG